MIAFKMSLYKLDKIGRIFSCSPDNLWGRTRDRKFIEKIQSPQSSFTLYLLLDSSFISN